MSTRVEVGLAAGRRAIVALLLLTASNPSFAAGEFKEFPLAPGSVGLTDWHVEGITTGPDGALWFTEPRAGRVGRITMDGRISEFTGVDGAQGIASGSDGFIYVTSGWKFLFRLAAFGATSRVEIPTATRPSGIAAGPDGNVWFSETPGIDYPGGFTACCAIGRITPGGVVTEFPIDNLSGALVINLVSAGGYVWGEGGSHLRRVSPTGAMARVDFDQPHCLSHFAVGPDGNFWSTADISTCSTGRDQVARVTPAGGVTRFNPPTPNSGPAGIVAGPDGNVWFTEYQANKIGRITPSGAITEFAIPTADSGPTSITTGPDGNIWFVESKADKIGRLTLTGSSSGKVTSILASAASIHGLNGSDFRTDVWLLNQSFTAPASATLTYRCYADQNCGAGSVVVPLAPRQTLLLADIVSETFHAEGTAGAIEIGYPPGTGPIATSARVYTPSLPAPTVGTAVPALQVSGARSWSVILGVGSSGDLSQGFRTNVGAYNPGSEPASVTFTLHQSDGTALGSVTRTFAPFEAFQLSPHVGALLAPGRDLRDAYLVIAASTPVLAYATVIDNQTNDSAYLLPADDLPPPSPRP